MSIESLDYIKGCFKMIFSYNVVSVLSKQEICIN